MILGNLDDVTVELIQGLCDEKTPESPTLEFKLALPPATLEGRQELMKDVCALANADGGNIVYGLAESAGTAAKPVPMGGETPDAAVRRVTQTLDSVEPRIGGLKIRAISAGTGFFLVVRVPASFDGPHSFRVEGDQIRSAFDRSATVAERARDFIEHRLRLVGHYKTSMPFRPGPVAVVVWVPIASLRGRGSVDIAAINNHFGPLAFSDWGGVSRSMNLDGLVVYPGGTPKAALTQVFRSGAIEKLRTAAALSSPEKLIPSGAVTRFFREAVWKCAEQSRRLGQTGPCVVKCALMHTDGYEFVAGEAADRSRTTADRSHIALPDTWIEAMEDLKSIEQVDGVVRPMMDVLWQAFDLERCFDYALDGSWSPDR